ncbi:MAG: phage holin family protein [Prolixibacteraceae bacterium]|nr:phage holin family protein [Prolixibacteraceae bacterium]MBN2648820.1 phage holin family protein [Prolixibacteraceae bacterium]
MHEKINTEFKALKEELEEYAKIQTDITKLHLAGELSQFTSGFMFKTSMLFIFLFVLLFFSAAAALFVGKLLHSYVAGLLITGGFYLLIALFIWLVRKPLFEKPAIRRFMHLMYPNTGNHEQ